MQSSKDGQCPFLEAHKTRKSVTTWSFKSAEWAAQKTSRGCSHTLNSAVGDMRLRAHYININQLLSKAQLNFALQKHPGS